VDLCGSQRGKSGHPEETDRGSFWRGTAIDIDTKGLQRNNLGGYSYMDLWRSTCASHAKIMSEYLYKEVIAL